MRTDNHVATFADLDKQIAYQQKLAQALRLLEKVWMDVGPYNGRDISPDTMSELRDYFEFDDSE